MDMIAAAKYISSGLVGMLVGGLMFWFVALPAAYDQRFEVMNQTIEQMEKQVDRLVSQNEMLIQENERLIIEVAGLSQQVARLSGFPVQTGE